MEQSSESSALVTDNPDYLTACSILQYFGRYLGEVVPSHRVLAEMVTEQPMSRRLLNIYKWLASKRSLKIGGNRFAIFLTSDANRAELNLTADECADIRAKSGLVSSVALRLKLFVGLLQQWVFAADRTNLYRHRPDPSLLGTDRTGCRYRFTLDYELTLHVYAEQSATGPWLLLARNPDDLQANCIGPLSAPRALDEEEDPDNGGRRLRSKTRIRIQQRLECPLCEPGSVDSAIGSCSDTDDWPQPGNGDDSDDGTTYADHQLCVKCGEHRLLERLRRLRDALGWLQFSPLADRELAISLLPDQQVAHNAAMHPLINDSLHIEDPHVCATHFRRIYAEAVQRVAELLATTGSPQQLKLNYIRQVRVLLEIDCHIWQGVCSPAQLSQLDRLQERVQLVLDRFSNAGQLEPLAMRRDRHTLREFHCLARGDTSHERPQLMRKFAHHVIDKGSLPTSWMYVVYMSAGRSFLMRAAQLFLDLPHEQQREFRT